MRKIQNDRLILTFVVTFILLLAPLDFFNYKNSFRFWPYYHWEIGFGKIPFNQEQQIIFIEAIDGVDLVEPKRMSHFFVENNLNWNPTKDYLIQREMRHALDSPRLAQVQNILTKKYFQQLGKSSVRYHLSSVTIDPIEFYKSGEIIHEELLLEATSEW